ncbi:partial Cellulosome-anchoring protein, partial [uncultured bacterium]
AGTIRDAVTGLPLAYRNVAIHDANGDIVGYAYSGAGGTYSYSGLQPGSYFVATTGSTDYVDELWENLDCGAPCDVTRGTPVVVAFGVITSGIDFDLRLPYFSDVPLDHWARRYIEGIFVAGITSGCGPGVYCPARSLSRAEMAVLLLTAEHGSAYVPPAPTGSIFTDVPADHWAGAFIEALAAEGVTSGCGAGNYCPDNLITRAEMAVFLLAAEHGPDWIPPAPTGTVFGDVPGDHWAAAYIEALAAEGVTSGCGGGNFCPEGTLNRAEMAVFLSVTFGITLD